MRIRCSPMLMVLAAIIACSCASTSQRVLPRNPEEVARVKNVFASIDEQNRTVKKSEAWLRDAYAEIGIRRIHDIPPEEHGRYGSYVRNNEVYIVVHPGYFPFFDKWEIPIPASDYSRGYPAQNLVERATADLPQTNIAYRVAREQERIERDFIEFMSFEKRLVILVLPRNYKETATYGAVPGADEYARYINELTNRGESIVYLESIAHNDGEVRPDDLAVLMQFLKAVEAKTIYLGGGFLGKCLDGFYGSLRTVFSPSEIYYIPEITAFSPVGMVTDKGKLLTESGKLSIKGVQKYFRAVAFNRSTGEPLKWMPLPLYSVYQNR